MAYAHHKSHGIQNLFSYNFSIINGKCTYLLKFNFIIYKIIIILKYLILFVI